MEPRAETYTPQRFGASCYISVFHSQGVLREMPLYDVFICHAGEDKDSLVRPLARALREHRVEVWYDEFCLRPGDSLRRAIDKGLASSRLGVVVLSPSFFAKSWPQWELDGLVQRELAASDPVIIPVWHGVTHRDVLSYSPPLADKFAIPSGGDPRAVAQRLLEVIHPKGSTLLIARDLVIEFGGNPPVVTDDWWLDVVEANSANPVENTFQEAMGWGRWGFPLPERGDTPEQRGFRLGWAAMQMIWMRAARERKVSQITRPEVVLAFIEEQPGLRETCEEFLHYLACYAPQLVIPGLGGPFEHVYEEALAESTREQRRPMDWLALRRPDFDSLDAAANVACEFVQGFAISFGPECKAFSTIDYAAWFLSSASDWMPRRHHRFLLSGMKEWAMWPWSRSENDSSDYPFAPVPATGRLFEEIADVPENRETDYGMSQDAEADLKTRLEFAASILGLPETASELVTRFKREQFIEAWFEKRRAKMTRSPPLRRTEAGSEQTTCLDDASTDSADS